MGEFMLAYTVTPRYKDLLFSCSDGREQLISTWEDAVTFCLMPCEFAVVYSVDDFVSQFSKLLPKDLAKKLAEGGRVILPDTTRLFYEPSRMFAVTYAGKEVNFFGLSRYSETPVETTQGLLELGQKVIEAYKVFGITPTKLSSPVAVFAERLSELDFPRACDLPDSAMDMINLASEHMTEEWREVFKLGHWNEGETSDADLCAGYPSLIAKLPDISDATFFESDTMPDRYSYGLLIGDLEVIRNVSPFQDANGIHFKGLKRDFTISTDGLWLINRYGGNFTLKHGLFIDIPHPYQYPFRETMEHLYLMRDYPDKLVSDIAKGISVGIYGMLTQRYPKGDGWKLGDNFNSIYGRMVTDRCSLRVADLIYRHELENRVINITVDGLLTEGNLDIPTEKHFGQWRLNERTPALVLSQLYAWHGDKHPNGLYYPEMIDLIKKNPRSSVFGGVDLNLLEYSRNFPARPRNGNDLLTRKFESQPL